MWRKMRRVLCAENINVIKSLVYCTSGVFFLFIFLEGVNVGATPDS